MKAIEFYTTPEGEVTMRPIGEAERQLKETDTDFIQAFLSILRSFTPKHTMRLWIDTLKVQTTRGIGIL